MTKMKSDILQRRSARVWLAALAVAVYVLTSGSTRAAQQLGYTGPNPSNSQSGYSAAWAAYVRATTSNVNVTVLGPTPVPTNTTVVITCRCQGRITTAGTGTTVGAGFYIESRAFYTNIAGTVSTLGSMTLANLTDSGVFDTVNSSCLATQSGTTIGCSINPVTKTGTLGTLDATTFVDVTYN